MNNKMGSLIKLIPSNKLSYILQVVVFFAIVIFSYSIIRNNGYTMKNNPDSFALWATMWLFGFFGTLQFFVMLLTKAEIYENGIILKKGFRKINLPFECINASNWGKVRSNFVTIAYFLEFHYSNEKGKSKLIRLHSNEVSKKALKNLSQEYEEQIKFDANVIARTQIYSRY